MIILISVSISLPIFLILTARTEYILGLYLFILWIYTLR